MAHDFYKEAETFTDQMVKWRRDLHQIPELGTDLPQTRAYIQEELTKMGIPFTASKEHSHVVVTLGQGSPCLLLRGDMDALPMPEESGEEFAATNGNMHACGHDFHASNMLGAAKLLKEHESELKGTVKLLIQSGEEVFQGAITAIEEGILENPKVDHAFGMHIDASLPVGTISYGYQTLAGLYGFRIEVKGRGAHGAYPSSGASPINAAAHIYLGLQELIAREIRPEHEATLTVGTFHSGNANNVIPEMAYMEGTLRAFDTELFQKLVQRLHEVTENVGKAYRCEAKVICLGECTTVDCDPAWTDEAIEILRESNPDLKIVGPTHNMGSEDFSFFTQALPATFLFFGSKLEDDYPYYPEHNPKVRFNERSLAWGPAYYATVAMEYMNRHGK